MQHTITRAGALPESKHPLGLVDMAALCDLLRVSRSSAERLIKSEPGFPRPFRIAGRRFVRIQDLQRWVAEKAKLQEFVA